MSFVHRPPGILDIYIYIYFFFYIKGIQDEPEWLCTDSYLSEMGVQILHQRENIPQSHVEAEGFHVQQTTKAK